MQSVRDDHATIDNFPLLYSENGASVEINNDKKVQSKSDASYFSYEYLRVHTVCINGKKRSQFLFPLCFNLLKGLNKWMDWIGMFFS